MTIFFSIISTYPVSIDLIYTVDYALLCFYISHICFQYYITTNIYLIMHLHLFYNTVISSYYSVRKVSDLFFSKTLYLCEVTLKLHMHM